MPQPKSNSRSVVFADLEPAGLLLSSRVVRINTSDEQTTSNDVFVDPVGLPVLIQSLRDNISVLSPLTEGTRLRANVLGKGQEELG